MKLPCLEPDFPSRDAQTKYRDYKSDIVLEYNDSVRVEFPDGTILLLHAGWDTPSLRGAGLTVYTDTDKNPVLQYHRDDS